MTAPLSNELREELERLAEIAQVSPADSDTQIKLAEGFLRLLSEREADKTRLKEAERFADIAAKAELVSVDGIIDADVLEAVQQAALAFLNQHRGQKA